MSEQPQYTRSGHSPSQSKVSFRAVEREDLSAILRLRNDESTWVHLTDPRLVSMADQEGWFSKIGISSGRCYFVAFDAGNPFIGLVRMDEHDAINQSIRVGADVVPELRGRGFGRKIFEEIERYCFCNLNIHRIWLCVLETNKVAIGLYEKSGFQLEGRYRKAIWRGGRWVDYLLMSILSEEYNGASPTERLKE